jgi:putative membrane protein
MNVLAKGFMALVALIHVYILVLEMFLWERAINTFKIPEELWESELVQTLLFNQGAYNGFLAAGIIFGLMHTHKKVGRQFQLFFAGCVVVAGIVGAATAGIKILFIQTIPALLAMVLTWLATRKE